MVLNKKPVERNRNILLQKGRKLSRKQEVEDISPTREKQEPQVDYKLFGD